MKTPREVLLSRHRDIGPKLERMWPSVAAVCDRRGSREVGAHRAPLQLLWRELIWPCWRVWAGLACAWALIAVLNLASREPTTQVASKAQPPSRAEMQALIEQRRMLAQLIEPTPAPHLPTSTNPHCPVRAARRIQKHWQREIMTDQPSTWQRTTTRRFLKWLFSWRTARRALISFAVLVTLIGLFYAEEDFRGKHAWDNYRRELEARGEQLDWNAYIPKPIPDNQNFAATPLIQSWFERIKPHYESWSDRKNKPAEDCYGQAEINVAEAQTKGEYSFRRRNSSLERGDRHFLDLVAWGSAFDAIRPARSPKGKKSRPETRS